MQSNTFVEFISLFGNSTIIVLEDKQVHEGDQNQQYNLAQCLEKAFNKYFTLFNSPYKNQVHLVSHVSQLEELLNYYHTIPHKNNSEFIGQLSWDERSKDLIEFEKKIFILSFPFEFYYSLSEIQVSPRFVVIKSYPKEPPSSDTNKEPIEFYHKKLDAIFEFQNSASDYVIGIEEPWESIWERDMVSGTTSEIDGYLTQYPDMEFMLSEVILLGIQNLYQDAMKKFSIEYISLLSVTLAVLLHSLLDSQSGGYNKITLQKVLRKISNKLTFYDHNQEKYISDYVIQRCLL